MKNILFGRHLLAVLPTLFLGFTLWSPDASAQAIGISISPHNIVKEHPMDTLLYTVTYEATRIRDLDRPEEVDHDIVNLEIGPKSNKLYSVNLHETDVQAKKDMDSGLGQYRLYQSFAQLEEIYFLTRKGKMMVFVRDIVGGPALLYQESIPEVEWQLGSGTKEILGYKCLSAECDYRGRHYTAWYTTDIPLRYGPWTFGGLPGLILELVDDTEAVHFTATGLKKAKPGEQIVQWMYGTREVSRKEARKAVRYMFAHPAQYFHQVTEAFLFNDGGQVRDEAYYPYNPIELE